MVASARMCRRCGSLTSGDAEGRDIYVAVPGVDLLSETRQGIDRVRAGPCLRLLAAGSDLVSYGLKTQTNGAELSNRASASRFGPLVPETASEDRSTDQVKRPSLGVTFMVNDRLVTTIDRLVGLNVLRLLGLPRR